MARWEPNARARLEEAALELYRERGFDDTSVADIAARAGLTERTFFRYFADKREVLFGNGAPLQDFVVEKLTRVTDVTIPLDAVAAAFDATAPVFESRFEVSKIRRELVAANASLQERELIKLAALAAGIGAELRRRGVAEPAASLAAEAGVAMFKIAFERWITDEEHQHFAHHLHESLRALRSVTAPAGRTRPISRPARRSRRAST